ncbi:MAG: hypothetical protein I4O49_01025 [Janthinobacterium lividum]|nr:hypothetical protein [Janthinobacterium lividum]
MTALGAIFGNLLYAHTLGDPTDYHWMRTFMSAIFSATGFVLLRKQWNTSAESFTFHAAISRPRLQIALYQ